MKKIICLVVITSLTITLLVSLVQAQDKQWLQYHSSREARQSVGSTGSQSMKSTTERPEGVELPVLKDNEPLFFKWSSPMANNGHLLMAIDRTSASGAHNLLYIDSDGDGDLKDETVIEAYRTNSTHAYFGPVKVTFEGEDGPITYHLNLSLCDHGPRTLFARSGCWYEGTVTVDGAKRHCMLIDYNANGTFDDKSINANDCDRIRIGEEGSKDIGFVGNYIEVDNKLCRLEIARDGAYVKLVAAEDVTFGTIRLSETITEFAAGGENGLFTPKPEKGTGSLPVGRYRINYWAIERKDNAGKNWRLQGSIFSEKGDFDITADKETELSISEPIISTLEARRSGSGYSFSQNLQGRLGERIELTRDGAQPPAPKLHIKSKDGTYDRTFSFEYG